MKKPLFRLINPDLLQDLTRRKIRPDVDKRHSALFLSLFQHIIGLSDSHFPEENAYNQAIMMQSISLANMHVNVQGY